MPQGTCAVDGCEDPARSRDWCNRHYKRWRQYGDPLGAPPPRPTVCVIDGCDKPLLAQGWCGKHYQRWKACGDPQGREWPETCAIDDCEAKVKARGWCVTHYQRWKMHRDPLGVAPPRPPKPLTDAPKVCNACGELKPRTAFRKRKGRRPDSVAPDCRACESEKSAAWAKANPDKVRQYSSSSPERRSAVNARYRANPENRVVLRAVDSRKDPVKRRERQARRRAQERATRVALLDYQAIFDAHGGICGICGEPVDPQRYHMDHIVALANGGTHTADNLQPAHPICNQRKGARPWPCQTFSRREESCEQERLSS